MIAAIYSRKSIFTGKGDSIENQIELCKQYGDRLNITNYIIYEDEGFSGGNLNRPKFQELLKDAKDKKFKVLICYRLDRISRNVADFSSTLELLQTNNIDFISIKEQFDTSTPMGRAMVYISSVFAQLERETIAERVRDNMLQLAKTGRWLGGQEPMGYSSERMSYIDSEFKERSLMKLIPIEEELAIVKLIYTKYIELHSITQVVKHLTATKTRGKNGGEWASMQVKRILSSPLYVRSSEAVNNYLKKLGINVFGDANGNGYLTYNKTKNIIQDRAINEWISAVGKHPGIIEADNWLEVQRILGANKGKKLPRLGTGDNKALLNGILKCKYCGANMKIKQGHKSKKNSDRYDYYVCSSKDSSYGVKCSNKNIRVDILDKLVMDLLNVYNKDFLMEELSNEIKNQETLNIEINQINNFKASIRFKEKEINNLVKELRKDCEDITKEYIRKDIEELHEQIMKLQIAIDQFENSSCNLNINTATNETSVLFNDIFNEFDILKDIKHKRNLLKSIIEDIIWDGENKRFEIHLKKD